MQTYNENKALQQKVGENIERIRVQKKKPVKEVAAILHLSDTAYRNIERGITEISLTKIFHVADILKIHPSALLDIEGYVLPQANGNDSTNKQVVEGYKLRIQQFKEETSFLKKQIEVLEEMILKHQKIA